MAVGLGLNLIFSHPQETLQPTGGSGFNSARHHMENSSSHPNHSTQSQLAVGGAGRSSGTSGSTILLLLLRLRQCCGHLSLMKDVSGSTGQDNFKGLWLGLEGGVLVIPCF